ncbi:hypothetical protein [uncultured Nocardioides sp.]|uniref:hypothetical protein n=1 Tax=uncultured Nocardioides sp. TaxID=198441 RepID=UPI0026304DE0|nr:hypothetical protein [uncultured Nocardioides sp.]
MAGRRKSHGDEWWAKHPEVVRCNGTIISTGEQCRTEAHPGASVCFKHGANLPAVREKAARRIGTSLDDAVRRLQAMLDDPATEPRDKIRILHDLLDRGGLGATSKVLLGVTEVDPVEDLFRRMLAEPGTLVDARYADEQPEASDEVFAALNRAADRDGADEDLIGDVVDAELVEDDPAPSSPDRHFVHETRSMSDRPPTHIRRDLERLGLLR